MLLCLHLDRPLSKQKNAKKPYRTKSNWVHVQLEKIMNKKTKKPLIPLLKSQEWVWKAKVGYRAWPLRSTWWEEWTKNLSYPSSPTSGHAPTLIQWIRKKAHPFLGEQARKVAVIHSHSPLLQQEPQQSLAEKNDTLYLADCIQIDYILCCQRWRSSIQSGKTRPGADWGSD